MSTAIKIRRAGIGVGVERKVAFRAWLNEQPRKQLSYKKKGSDPRAEEVGWTTEEFVKEAAHRGVDIPIGTVFKWAMGSQPRVLSMIAVKRAFSEARF